MASNLTKYRKQKQLLWRGLWPLEMGSLSLDGFSVPGCPPSVAQEMLAPLEESGLIDCGVCLGNTGYQERPSGSRLLERNSEEVVGSGAQSHAGPALPAGRAPWWRSWYGLAPSDGWQDRNHSRNSIKNSSAVCNSFQRKNLSKIKVWTFRFFPYLTLMRNNEGWTNACMCVQDRFPLDVMDPLTPFPPETQAQHL